MATWRYARLGSGLGLGSGPGPGPGSGLGFEGELLPKMAHDKHTPAVLGGVGVGVGLGSGSGLAFRAQLGLLTWPL